MLWSEWNATPTVIPALQGPASPLEPVELCALSEPFISEGYLVGCPSPRKLIDCGCAQIGFLEELFIAFKLAAYSFLKVKTKAASSFYLYKVRRTKEMQCVWSGLYTGIRAPG